MRPMSGRIHHGGEKIVKLTSSEIALALNVKLFELLFQGSEFSIVNSKAVGTRAIGIITETRSAGGGAGSWSSFAMTRCGTVKSRNG